MPAIDDSRGKGTGLESPVSNLAIVTPSDAADLAFVSRAVWLGVGGALRVTTLGGQTVTTPALAAGVPHPIRAARIWATGTTATGIMVAW